MDAICFVVGLSARMIRGEKLKDLIYSSSAKSAKSAYVSMIYIVDENEVEGVAGGTELVFTRAITSAGSNVYKLNNQEVSFEAYSARLEEINIVTRSRNFLVFQV
jgi:structural maintenance of chromosome 1